MRVPVASVKVTDCALAPSISAAPPLAIVTGGAALSAGDGCVAASAATTKGVAAALPDKPITAGVKLLDPPVVLGALVQTSGVLVPPAPSITS